MFFNKSLLDGLFEDVALTNSQWKRSLILSNVHAMYELITCFHKFCNTTNLQKNKSQNFIYLNSQQNTLLNDYPTKMSLVLFDRFGGGFSAIL